MKPMARASKRHLAAETGIKNKSGMKTPSIKEIRLQYNKNSYLDFLKK